MNFGWHRIADCFDESKRGRADGSAESHRAAGEHRMGEGHQASGEHRAAEVHVGVDGDPGEIKVAALPRAVSGLGDAVVVSNKAQDRVPDLA
ncbi:hypothetical protein [Streptomyces niveus]|uniref:hypothetical protein n=1 Tax=Streptomyces niveus TaxID=193462 RepID=UPI001319E9E1|nr:hypothetical protein [Streptomyces niveus]